MVARSIAQMQRILLHHISESKHIKASGTTLAKAIASYVGDVPTHNRSQHTVQKLTSQSCFSRQGSPRWIRTTSRGGRRRGLATSGSDESEGEAEYQGEQVESELSSVNDEEWEGVDSEEEDVVEQDGSNEEGMNVGEDIVFNTQAIVEAHQKHVKENIQSMETFIRRVDELEEEFLTGKEQPIEEGDVVIGDVAESRPSNYEEVLARDATLLESWKPKSRADLLKWLMEDDEVLVDETEHDFRRQSALIDVGIAPEEKRKFAVTTPEDSPDYDIIREAAETLEMKGRLSPKGLQEALSVFEKLSVEADQVDGETDYKIHLAEDYTPITITYADEEDIFFESEEEEDEEDYFSDAFDEEEDSWDSQLYSDWEEDTFLPDDYDKQVKNGTRKKRQW